MVAFRPQWQRVLISTRLSARGQQALATLELSAPALEIEKYRLTFIRKNRYVQLVHDLSLVGLARRPANQDCAISTSTQCSGLFSEFFWS